VKEIPEFIMEDVGAGDDEKRLDLMIKVGRIEDGFRSFCEEPKDESCDRDVAGGCKQAWPERSEKRSLW